jgi:peptide deformylase
MIREVLRMGDPRLLERSQEVARFNTPAIDALLVDMRDTMQKYDGAGLAAPQIGVPLRVVIFGVERNPRYPDAEPVPYTEIINPVLVPLSDDMEEGWEGCLSVPGLRGVVSRYSRIGYTGYDPKGGRIEREVSGFHARVVQHECDHLDGILYPMRVRDFARFGYTDVLFPDIAEAPADD